MKRNAAWMRKELNGVIRELREVANESATEANDCLAVEFGATLRGRINALGYAASQIERVLRGDTMIEDMAKRLQSPMKGGKVGKIRPTRVE